MTGHQPRLYINPLIDIYVNQKINLSKQRDENPFFLNMVYQESRIWGEFKRFTLNEKSTVKILTINPNQKISLQYHNQREEFWYVIEGSGIVNINDGLSFATKHDTFRIKPKEVHRVRAGENGIKILEISTGLFDEEDIIRMSEQNG